MIINKNLVEEAKFQLCLLGKEMDELKIQCNGEPKITEQTITCDKFFDTLNQYIVKGLDRGDVYNILQYLYKNLEYTDELYEYETGLTGYCSSLCVHRFPNEPDECIDGSDNLYAYVHSLKWKHG